MNIEEAYLSRRSQYRVQVGQLSRVAERVAKWRMVTALAAALMVYFLHSETPLLASLIAISGLLLFGMLVFKHHRLKKQIDKINIFIEINNRSLQRLNGEWVQFEDSGKEFCDEQHPYSSDLDVFGDYSLFQYINVASSLLGREALCATLRASDRPLQEIAHRQQAIDELAKDLDWRQKFQAWGESVKRSVQSPANIIAWANSDSCTTSTPTRMIIRVLPFVSVTLLVLTVMLSWSILIPLASYLVQVGIFLSKAKHNIKELKVFSQQLSDLEFYTEALRCIEDKTFKSEYLHSLQSGLNNSRGETPSACLAKLSSFVEYGNVRFVLQIHFVLNVFLLWDAQCVLSLEQWKTDNGKDLESWLQAIAQIEALSSLAILRFDHPDWGVPNVLEGGASFKAECLGHPLITDKERKGNSVALHRRVGTTIVTGSNMSGKSTLLRTVGLNLVLAYAGAPVCAQSLSCRKMAIYTSMRIHDDLGKSISTFYGELLKIKRIIDAVSQSEETVLVIIDEIFRGTNSRDRYEGAIAVIKALCHSDTVAILSTHDLALCDMEKSMPDKISNVHFSESFTETGMEFDYTLKPGVSTTSNAGHLMRLIGLQIDEESGHEKDFVLSNTQLAPCTTRPS